MADQHITQASEEDAPALEEAIFRYWGRQLRQWQQSKAENKAQQIRTLAAFYRVSEENLATILSGERDRFSKDASGPSLGFAEGASPQLGRPSIGNLPVPDQGDYRSPKKIVWVKLQEGAFEGDAVRWILKEGQSDGLVTDLQIVVETNDPAWFNQIARIEIQDLNGTATPVYIALPQVLPTGASGRMNRLPPSSRVLSSVRRIDPKRLTAEETEKESERILTSRNLALTSDPDALLVWDEWQKDLPEEVLDILSASNASAQQTPSP